jgi:valyl-tRNA synthetase
MLHPFMPFITEELWHALADPAQRRKYDLIHAAWPEPNANVDELAKTEIEWVISLIKDVRAARSELNVPPSARPTMTIYEQSDMVAQYLSRNEAALMRLARVELTIWIGGRDTDVIVERLQNAAVQQGEIAIELEGFGANIELAGVIDLDAERSRITKAIEAATKERDALAGRLSNAAFLEKAKPEAVEKARADHAEKAAEAERLTAALKRLG